MNIGHRIKNLRVLNGLTQGELGGAVGVSANAVGMWERGVRTPSTDALAALSKALRCPVDELLGICEGNFSSFMLTADEKGLLTSYRTLDSHGKKLVASVCAMEVERVRQEAQRFNPRRERYIPRYSTPSAAGSSVPLDGADFEMILADDSVPARADFAVNIHGRSMEPYIHDGDMVYVEKDAELSIGDVGIFCVDGAMYCKQYYVDPEGNLILVSANPELKDTNVFVSADGGRFVQTMGKVLMGIRVRLPEYLFD